MRIRISIHCAMLCVASAIAGLCVPAAASANPTIKKLVLEDCEAAKAALATEPVEELAALSSYLVEVLHLKLSELLPPIAPRMPRMGENPSRIEPAQVDPLRVVDPEEERRARRCAVDLLGLIGAPAASALPELAHYGSQNELDDASRNITQRALFSIAEKSSESLPISAVHDLVAGLESDNVELIRSILLILARRQGVPITEELIAQEKIPYPLAARVISEVAGADRARLLPVFESRLVEAGLDLKRVVLILKQLHWHDLSLTGRYAQLLLSEIPSVSQEAGALLQEAGVPCAGLSQVPFAPYLPLLERGGVEGEAAESILKCLVSRGEFDAPRISEFVRSPSAIARARVASLIPASELPAREKGQLLQFLLEDPEVSVQEAAINGMRSGAAISQDDYCGGALKWFKARMKSGDIALVSDALPAIGLAGACVRSTQRAAWLGILESLFSRLAARKGLEALSKSEISTLSSALVSLGGDLIELPVRMLKRKADRERYLAAQLILAVAAEESKYLKSAVGLLGDELQQVRYAALQMVLELKLLTAPLLRAGIQSKNVKLRGASVLLLPGLAARKPAELRAVKDWFQLVSCEEILQVLPDFAPRVPDLKQGVLNRLPECLSLAAEERGVSLSQMLRAVELDSEHLEQIVSMALDTKFDNEVTLKLALAGADAGFSPTQTKRLIGILLDRGGDSEILGVLPALRQLRDDGKELLPALKRLAEKSEGTSPLRCQLLGAMSYLAADAMDWLDYFRDELRRDDEGSFSSCAENTNPAVVQPALVELLRDAPIRKRANILRVLALLNSYQVNDEFKAQIVAGLAAENQEVRCQATRVAVRAAISTPEAIDSVRWGLYGECWEAIRTTTGAEDLLLSLSREILMSARNNLEIVRATELFNLQTKGQLKR